MKHFNLFKSLLVLGIVLITCNSQMWAEDITITPTYNNRYETMPYGLVNVSGTVKANSSGVYSASSNGGTYTLTFTTTKTDMYIKSVTFNSVSNGTLSSSDGTITSSVFTASGSKKSVTITMTSNSGKKGSCKITNVVVNAGSNTVETHTAFSVSSSTVSSTAKIDGSTVTSAVSMTTTGSASDGKLSIPNNGTITFTSSSNILYIAFFNPDNKILQSNQFQVNSTKLATGAWSGSAKTVEVSNKTGAARDISHIWVITEAAAAKDYTVTATVSGGVGGTVSAAASSLDATETTTITATPASGYQVTNWAVSGTGASVSPSGASNSNTTTLTMGTANATVTVTFGLIDYAVTKTLTNCAVKDGSTAIPSTMNYGDDLSTTIEPTSGNLLPSSITVSGVTSYTWNALTGALTLTDVTGAVSISISAGSPQTGSGATVTYTMVTSGSTAATYSTGVFTGILSGGTTNKNTIFASNILSGGNGVGVQDGKTTPNNSRTAGMTSSTSAFSAGSSPYAEFTFDVVDGYTFTPTAISVPVMPITNNAYFTAIVTDGSSTWTSATSECTQGAQATINATPSGGSALTGTVNIRVFCHSQATAAKGFRIGTGSVTITGTVESAASCTAPNHVDVSGRWDRFGGETISLTATAYSSAGTGSPIADANITGWQWQKLVSSTWTNVSNGTVDGVTTSGATTKNLQIANCGLGNSGKYRCVVSTGATCSTASATATDGTEGFGVKVYVLECYTGGTTVHNFTRTGSSQAGTLTMDLSASTAYTFKVHADNDYYGNNGTANEDLTNWVFSTSQGNFTINSGLGGTFTIGVEYSTGGNSSVEGEPEISVTYPRKTIYLAPNSDWLSDNAKFAYYYFRDGGSNGWTDFLTSNDCGRYADIPQWNGIKMDAVRLDKASTSPNWDDKWNQTSDITISSNDLVTITGWDESQNYGTYSAPTYTISYAKGSPSASISGSKANETKTCGVDFTLPSSAVFTREGYLQTGWTTSDGGAQTHALGGSYTTNDDQTFYPVWTVQSYNLTWNLGGGTTTSAGTGIASGVSVNTTTSQNYGVSLTAPTVTKDNYDFSAWSPSVASTMPAAATTYTATWTAQTHNVSFSLTNAAYSSGTDEGEDVATYGTNYSVTFAATSGYSFPSDITVQIGGVTKTKGTHYTWNASTGTLVVTGSYITGDIAISFAAIDDALHVTYDGGSPTSGSAPEDDNSYDVDDEVTVLGDNSMSKTDYTFRGWSDGTTFFLPGQKFTITDNVTLTAVWDATGATKYYYGSITITAGALTPGSTGSYLGFFTNTGGTIATSTVISLSTTPGEGGYYYESSTLTDVALENSSNWNSTSTTNRTIRGFKFKSGDTYTLALGSNVASSIKFYGKNGSASKTMTVGGVSWTCGSTKEVFEPHEFTKAGGFTGNISISQDGDFYGILVITIGIESTGKTVTFDKGSGPSTVTGMPGNIEGITSGLYILEPEEEPSAANYIFNGWVTTSGGSTPFNFASTAITSDKTIYAKWTAKTSPGSGTVSGTTSICSGSNTNVTLSTSVSGASYQLYKDNVASGVAKAGTGGALTWSVSAAGTYTVKAVETATHASGDMGGSATISIYTALSKTTDPTSSQNATVGVGCALSGLTYAGNANVAFQWQTCTDATPSSASDITSGSQYSNYNTATMTFTPASAGTYYFRCVVSDDCGSSFNTSVVTVTAKVAPTIYSLTGEPTAICSDATATLTLSGSDDGVTYKLYKGGVDQSDDKVGDGNEITWTVSAAGSYTVKTVANATYAEATMSGTVTISITTATSITTQPATSPTAHDGVSFTLGSGMEVAGASISYKWYSYTSSGGAGEAVIAGATSATYAVTKSTGTYYYKVEVIGTCGSVKSDMITLTVDNKHRITYDANGGSGAPSGNWKSPGSMTLPSDIPTYSGKVFLGWNTKDDGTGDMYQPGATYTMPSSAVTLYAAWETPCFSFSKGTKGTEPTDGFVMTPENINSSVFIGGATLSGGTLTNTSGAKLGINASYGFVMIKSTRELTLTLASGMFQEGTVITLEGYTNNENSKSYGFALGLVKVSGTKSTESTGAYTAFSQRYVVVADDGIEGTSSVVITMNGDCTGSQTYLSAIYIGGCMSCTTITPSLSYDNTTLYAFGGSPSTATPTVTGNTGNGTVTYSSNATGVATVDSETGVVTAVGSGTARITATIEPNGGYCGGSAYQDITVTAQGIVTQAINVDATTAWGTQANLAFSGSGSSHLSQVAVLANTGYTEQSTDSKAQKRDGRSMSVKFKGSGAATTISENKYFSLQFTVEEGYSLNIGRVIVPVQPVSYPLVAAIRISDTNGTTINPTASSSLSAGAIHDVVFDVSGTPLRGTVTLKVFFYNQNNSGTLNDAGFRWASPLLIYGDFVSDYIFETTGNWSTAANWNWGLLPTENDDVTILVPATVNTKTAVAKSVVINTDAPNTGKLTIANNGVLTVDGTITAIKSGAAAATAVSDVVIDCGETNQGALIFEQPTSGLQTKGTVNIYTKTSRVGGKLQWQYMGYPFNSGTDEDYDGYYINKYSETQGGWIVMRDQGDRTINAWDGLAIAGDGAGGAQLQGTFVPTTGDKELTLTYTAGKGKGKNLIGNSWTAPIQILEMEEEDFGGARAAIYVFNTGRYGSKEVSPSGSWVTLAIDAVKAGVDAGTWTNLTVIPAFQGFQVKTAATEDKTLTLNYDKHVRPATDATAMNEPLRAPARREQGEIRHMRLTVESDVAHQDVFLFEGPEFSEDFDNGWDGDYMGVSGQHAYLYVVSPRLGKLAIAAENSLEGRIVALQSAAEKEYTFTFAGNGMGYYLNDLKTQTSTLIQAGNSYTFNYENGDDYNRFMISVTPFGGMPSGLDEISGKSDKVQKVIYKDHVYIIRGGKIYGVDGTTVK